MRDNAPVGNTCPIIDKVISFISDLDFEDLPQSEIDSAISRMEEIRTMNESLRGWGNDEYFEILDLESRIGKLESKIEDLEYENKSLMKEIESLESELNTSLL